MLDEVYTDQYQKMSSAILDKRSRERKILSQKILNQERKNKDVGNLIEAIEKAQALYKKAVPYLESRGLRIREVQDVDFEFNTSYRNDITHPELMHFDDKTNEIEQKLAEKRKEIRARIYGMDTTYSEVEREVSAYLSDVANIK